MIFRYTMMYSCTETARHIGSQIVPNWGSKIMMKNRLDFSGSINLILRSQWVYLDLTFGIEDDSIVPHECIIQRCDDHYIVHDSYLNYRDVSTRYYTETDMRSYLTNMTDDVIRKLFDIPSEIPKVKSVNGYVSVLRV